METEASRVQKLLISQEQEIMSLRQRIEQLEAALREIESISVSSGGEIHGVTAKHWRDAFEQCRDISRAALAGEKKDG